VDLLNRKNLIFGGLIGVFCLVFAFIFILFGSGVFGPVGNNVDNASLITQLLKQLRYLQQY
jgi:uncharacterized membrane protein